jgi:hypothetical protein
MKNKLQFSKVLLMLFLAISFQTSFAQVTLKATSEKKNYSRPTRLAFDLINSDNHKVDIMIKINSSSNLVAYQKIKFN